MNNFYNQLYVYTLYFFKVLKTNKLALIYSALIPTIMMILQTNNQPYDETTLISWLSYMIYINSVSVILELADLREQGYLKQYSSIIKSNSIFILSKTIVNLVVLLLSTVFLFIIASFIYGSLLKMLLFKSLIIELLVFFPLVCLNLVFLAFRMKIKTINVVGNIIMFILLILTYLLNSTIFENFMFISLINPISFISHFFLVSPLNVRLSQLILNLSIVTILYLIIGIFSYKNLKILPVEG